MFSLKNKMIWVVGGAGYLGSNLTRTLSRQGAHVIISDSNEKSSQHLVQSLTKEKLSAQSLPLDVTSEKQIVAVANQIVSQHKSLDVLVNLACYSTGKPMESMTADEFNRGLNITLTGAYLLGREAARVMKPQGSGSMIQFASMYGVISPDPATYPDSQPINPIDYGAAKAGVLQMVRYMAMQLAPYNVRVNAITPGSIPNPDTTGQDPRFIHNLTQKVPMKRLGTPQDISGPVCFLASDASSYMTGTSLVVDGGWTIY